ncbi:MULTISPECIES: hypothetical protein [unclassified Marinimicrobium]|jgi:hypothetical protein|uniref:hypothetical protein n=1 Tax=unclassified Marinimicrobium TaxID=2632100 RepID=UPI0025811A12|nr:MULTISPECIES: hypothetical protein [unclassified Marinimicrobium]|tara:strand:+ start:75 stop:287 length:213 start_codon:yes stop_codon:yes gene_type:complete
MAHSGVPKALSTRIYRNLTRFVRVKAEPEKRPFPDINMQQIHTGRLGTVFPWFFMEKAECVKKFPCKDAA